MRSYIERFQSLIFLKRSDLAKVRPLWIILFLFFLFLSSPCFASENLLTNPGFEELLFGWETTSGLELGTNFTISSSLKNGGNYSALIKHTKTNSSGAQQIIKNIEGGNEYSVKGKVLFDDEKAKNARVRIAWYTSEDGSGSQMKTIDSNIIEFRSANWQDLILESIEAPLTAKSAKFRILQASSSEGKESFVYFDDLFFGLYEEDSVPSSPSPSPSSANKAIYKINDIKDNDGNILNSVKIYVDDKYTHHVDEEILTFGDSCQCYEGVDCGFGSHTIKLEKSGYDNWTDTKTFKDGDNFEVNPVMNKLESSTSSVSPSSSSSSSPETLVLSSSSPSLLGKKKITEEGDKEETDFTGEIFGATASSEEASQSSEEKKSFKPSLALLISLSGLLLLGIAGFPFLKPKLIPLLKRLKRRKIIFP